MHGKNIVYILLAMCIVSLASCKAQEDMAVTDEVPIAADMHTSENALDWDGVYRGVLPCADCEGISYVLTLGQDKKYTLFTRYLGKDDGGEYKTGNFVWDEDGRIITLHRAGHETGESKTEPRRFQVGENVLFTLDTEGQPITGPLAPHYRLTKVPDVALTEHYWKLFLLNGASVKAVQRDAHLILKNDHNNVVGAGGCNGLSGLYHKEGDNLLSFHRITLTEMACATGMDVEQEFIITLMQVASFSIQGDILILYDDAQQELARMEAVFLY